MSDKNSYLVITTYSDDKGYEVHVFQYNPTYQSLMETFMRLLVDRYNGNPYVDGYVYDNVYVRLDNFSADTLQALGRFGTIFNYHIANSLNNEDYTDIKLNINNLTDKGYIPSYNMNIFNPIDMSRTIHSNPNVKHRFAAYKLPESNISVVKPMNNQPTIQPHTFQEKNFQFDMSKVQFTPSTIQFKPSKVQFTPSTIQFKPSTIQFKLSNVQFK